MDFLSRDQQRHAVEQIADPSGEAQVQLALKAVESARAGGRAADRRPIARRTSAITWSVRAARISKPTSRIGRRSRTRVRRLALAHPTLLYLGSIAARDRRRCSRAAASGCAGVGGSAAIAGRRARAAGRARARHRRSRSCSGSSRGRSRRAGCRGSISPTACPTTRARWSIVPTLLGEPRGGRARCSSIWRCWRTAIWTRASTSRFSATSSTRRRPTRDERRRRSCRRRATGSSI